MKKLMKSKNKFLLNKTNIDIPDKNTLPKVHVTANNPKENSNKSNKTDSLNDTRNLEINWKEVNFFKMPN